MGDHEVKVIRSTADLTPDGILGYAKGLAGIVALVGAAVAAIQPYLPEGSDWARWAGLIVAFCGTFGVFALKNTVQPERVVTSVPAVPSPGDPFRDAVRDPESVNRPDEPPIV